MPARLRPRGWWLLWTVLGAGVLLRVGLMATYTPTVFHYYGGDSARYMRLPLTGVSGLFDDVAMPAGYPAFLATLRELSASLPLTTVAQHLLGLVAAALLYSAAIRIDAPRWAALIPAAVVCLSGDHLFLEHGIFTEALWMPVLALGMYLTARAISAERPLPWLAAGAAVLACSALVRHVSEVLPVVVAIWAALAFPAVGRKRLWNVAAVLLPAIAVIGVYLAIAKPLAGGYSGMLENQGFALYGRVAQFADCSRFTPPPGTRRLCIDIPPEQRHGPFFWTFGEQSPIHTRMSFEATSEQDQDLLASFGRAAITHQPVDYLRTVSRDFARFFLPGVGEPRPDSGSEASDMSFASTVPTAQGASASELAAQYDERYSDVGDGIADPASRGFWGAYQGLFRIGGLPLLLLVMLSIAACALSRGSRRTGAWLFLACGLVLLAFPPMFSSYEVRYTVPPIDLLAVSGGLGAAAIATKISESRRGMNSRTAALPRMRAR